jgi:hypothetical protein
VFLINSRLGLFTAADRSQHPFSRSYGVILPSSLTRVRSLTLGYSPRLPVSVYGTGSYFLTRSFSWQCDIRNFATIISLPITTCPYRAKPFTLPKTHCLDMLFRSHAFLSLLRPSIAQTKTTGTGISTCCPSPTPFGLGLGPD